jgi:NADPH:quinone reductase-like Zn-dependent oxidoreductase
MSNKAAWITKPKGNPLEVSEAPMPKAGKDEVVIKNHAVAVNPVDCMYFLKSRMIGSVLTSSREDPGLRYVALVNDACGVRSQLTRVDFILQKYPNVLGTDVAGVTHVKKGDRVLG